MTTTCVIQASPQVEVIINMQLCHMNQSTAEETAGGSLSKGGNVGQHLYF